MPQETQSRKAFSTVQIALVLVFVFSISGYIFYKNFSISALQYFNLSYVKYIFIALICLAAHDVANACRIKILSREKINVKNGIICALLFQFANAVTPPFIGNTAFPYLVFSRYKLSQIAASAVLIVLIISDQIMFLILIPLLYVLFGENAIFGAIQPENKAIVKGFLLYGYSSFLVISGCISIILYIAPKPFIALICSLVQSNKKVLHFVKKILFPLYKVSIFIKQFSYRIWIKNAMLTFCIWFLKFACGAVLLFPFIKSNTIYIAHIRQYFITVLQLATPTPGGAGTAEISFLQFFNDIVIQPETIVLSAFTWRFCTYYLYILLGVIVLPYWFFKMKKSN